MSFSTLYQIGTQIKYRNYGWLKSFLQPMLISILITLDRTEYPTIFWFDDETSKAK